MFSKELSLKAKITKAKILNPATILINVTKTFNNAVEMQENTLPRVIGSAGKNDVIAFESILVKRISEECLTMFNTNGSMRKTAKNNFPQLFSRHSLLEVPSVYVSLVDMGLIWRLASSTSDNCDPKTRSGIGYLWRD